MTRRRRQLAECPHCGATFAQSRLACPECGSDASTGWRSSEDIDYESVELPDLEAPPRAGTGRGVRVLLVVLAAALLALTLLRLF